MKKKYKTVKELEDAIDAYFETCKDELVYNNDGEVATDKSGNPIFIPHPPTVAGLALYLGFADRQSIYDYKGLEEFSCTIKNAITRIEEYAEQHLYIGRATGAIFWLKNHGWKDETKIDADISGSSLFAAGVEAKAKKYEKSKPIKRRQTAAKK